MRCNSILLFTALLQFSLHHPHMLIYYPCINPYLHVKTKTQKETFLIPVEHISVPHLYLILIFVQWEAAMIERQLSRCICKQRKYPCSFIRSPPDMISMHRLRKLNIQPHTDHVFWFIHCFSMQCLQSLYLIGIPNRSNSTWLIFTGFVQ